MKRGGFVYILTNDDRHTVLYTGVTSNLTVRMYQHKNKTFPKSFSANYNCGKLVYYYFYPTISEAISAEKQIKAGSRQDKIDLINTMNPDWADLSETLN